METCEANLVHSLGQRAQPERLHSSGKVRTQVPRSHRLKSRRCQTEEGGWSSVGLVLKTPFLHTTAATATDPVRAAAVVVRAGPWAVNHVGFTSKVASEDASWTFVT